jgi:hypothetical protein
MPPYRIGRDLFAGAALAGAFEQHPAGGHGWRSGGDVDDLFGLMPIVLVEDLQEGVEHAGIDEVIINRIGERQIDHLNIHTMLFRADKVCVVFGDGEIVGPVITLARGDQEKDLIDGLPVMQKDGRERPQPRVIDDDLVVVADKGKVDHGPGFFAVGLKYFAISTRFAIFQKSCSRITRLKPEGRAAQSKAAAEQVDEYKQV